MWWGLICCMLCEEYCDVLERDGGKSATEQEKKRIGNLRESIQRATLAAQNGSVVCSSLVVAIGRKVQ